MKVWVAELRANDLARSAAIRLDAGLEGALGPDDGSLWLRGRELNDGVLALPFLNFYRVESGDPSLLFPLDSQLPSRRLPADLEWTPIADSIVPGIELPVFSGGEGLLAAPIRVVRGGAEESPNLLRVSRGTWCEFAERAPQIRLEALTYAASPGEVVVRGNPLPPLPGQAWVERERIAIPAGHRFSPAVSPGVLRRSLRLAPGEMVLISPNGVVERIAGENFVPARRAAIRQMTS